MVLWATLMFCTGTGFVGSVVAALILLAVGICVLREKAAPAH